MSHELILPKLEFGSLLTYSPRGISDAEKRSQALMRYLKNDEVIPDPLGIPTSEYICSIVEKNLTKLPFCHFFESKPTLIPIPNSSLMKAETLWVPKRLADALHRNGLGMAVIDALRRVEPLPKAATSSPENRPKAGQHYESLQVLKILPEPKEILLVDDIITRGATMFGAANRLRHAFPRADIRAFAAIRTISRPNDFRTIVDPRIGEIKFDGQDTFREP